MALYADLGQVRLSNAGTDLHLTVSTSVQTSCLNADPISSNSCLQARLTPHSSWICRGNGLQLVIRLFLDGQYLGQHPWALQVQEFLSSVLTGAELWDQLNLQACLAVPQIPENVSSEDKASIILALFHSQANHTVFRPNLHRLSSGVPFADIKPPAGIRVYGFENVSISLDFSKPEDSNSKRVLASFENPPSKCSHEVEPEPNACLIDEEEMLWDREHCLRECNILASEDESASVGAQAPDTAPFQDTPVQAAQLLDMVDAALRMCICSKPGRLAPGIQIVVDDRVTQLADIAPAIWSPGYLPAVSSRACFLPTISHALSHSLLRNARSLKLKSKLRKLLENESSQAILGQDTNELIKGPAVVTPQSLYRSICTRLWIMLQRGVYDGRAARILKGIKSDSEPRSSSLDQFEMRDQLADTGQTIFLADFSEDQPLLSSNASDCDRMFHEDMLKEEVDDNWSKDVVIDSMDFTLRQAYGGDLIRERETDLEDNSTNENMLYTLEEDCNISHDTISNTSKVNISRASDEFDLIKNHIFIHGDCYPSRSFSNNDGPCHRYPKDISHICNQRPPEFYDDVDAGYFTSSQASVSQLFVPRLEETPSGSVAGPDGKISSTLGDEAWWHENDSILADSDYITNHADEDDDLSASQFHADFPCGVGMLPI